MIRIHAEAHRQLTDRLVRIGQDVARDANKINDAYARAIGGPTATERADQDTDDTDLAALALELDS